jgi:hypothetical protein
VAAATPLPPRAVQAPLHRPIPAPDALTEWSASEWSAFADGAVATVADDDQRTKVGGAAIRFDTEGGFDTWATLPAAQNGFWDFTALAEPGISFWVWAENPNLGFQNGSPWVQFHTTAGDFFELHARSEFLNAARGRWIQAQVPLAGDVAWEATAFGNPDESLINWIEIHADTWGAGFTLWIDGLELAAAQGPPPLPAWSVQPVLFVPDSASFPVGYGPTAAELAEDLANVEAAMDSAEAWYGQALGLPTALRIQEPVRLDGWGGLDAYEITWVDPERRYRDGISLGNTWGTVLDEVQSRGYTPGSQEDPHTIVIFCKGAGGFAGGAQWFGSTGGGICMLGDWCLDSLADRVPPEWWDWWSGRERQIGAAGHEMGHTWGLSHPDIPNPVSGEQDYEYTIMGSWWNWPVYPVNPADPDWPLHGLHGWATQIGVDPVPEYGDIFLLDQRLPWFSPASLPTAAWLGTAWRGR